MNHTVKTCSGEKLAPREVKRLVLSHTAFRNRTEIMMKVSSFWESSLCHYSFYSFLALWFISILWFTSPPP